jgi:hypothetical protein
MVVLVLDQVSGDVFYFSADRHGSFLWGCCVQCRGISPIGIASLKRPLPGYRK